MKLHQKKLLKLLAINSRFKNKDLAKALHVSEDTVAYTKREFLKKDVFSYSIFFDYRKLGYVTYHLLYSLQDISSVDMDMLSSLPDVIYINTFVGRYDLQVIILAKDDFEKKKKSIDVILGKQVLSSEVFEYEQEIKLTHVLPEYDVSVDIPKNRKDSLYALNDSILSADHSYASFDIDTKDLQIIEQLLQDPTITYKDISKKTGISRDTLRKRLTSYVKEKFLLGISMFPNLKHFGYNTYCLLLDVSTINVSTLTSFVQSKSHVFYVEIIQGSKNLFFYFWAKTPEEFSTCVKEIKAYFTSTIISLDLLFYDEYIFQREFPSSLLN